MWNCWKPVEKFKSWLTYLWSGLWSFWNRISSANCRESSSEISRICLMKCSSKTLKKIWHILETWKPYSFFVFHFILLYFAFNECPGPWALIRGKNKVAHTYVMKNTMGFVIFQKYDFFCSILLGHFIKHEPLIFEVWIHRTYAHEF